MQCARGEFPETSLLVPTDSRSPSTAWSSASRTTTSLRMTDGKRIEERSRTGERPEQLSPLWNCNRRRRTRRGRVGMDGAGTRTSGENALSSHRTAPLKPKSGLNGATRPKSLKRKNAYLQRLNRPLRSCLNMTSGLTGESPGRFCVVRPDCESGPSRSCTPRKVLSRKIIIGRRCNSPSRSCAPEIYAIREANSKPCPSQLWKSQKRTPDRTHSFRMMVPVKHGGRA